MINGFQRLFRERKPQHLSRDSVRFRQNRQQCGSYSAWQTANIRTWTFPASITYWLQRANLQKGTFFTLLQVNAHCPVSDLYSTTVQGTLRCLSTCSHRSTLHMRTTCRPREGCHTSYWSRKMCSCCTLMRRSVSLNSYGMFQPSGPNFRLSCTSAWKKHRPYSNALNSALQTNGSTLLITTFFTEFHF